MLQVGNLPKINQIQTKKTNTANTTNKMKLKNEQGLFEKTNKSKQNQIICNKFATCGEFYVLANKYSDVR